MTLPQNSSARLRLAVLFSVPLAFSLLFFVVNLSTTHNDTRILRLQTLQGTVATLRSIASDAEVGEHGFLLSGDERYLASLQFANARVDSESQLTPNADVDPLLQSRINHLLTLVKQRLDQANQVIETQRSKSFATALELTKSQDALELMGQIRREAQSLEGELNSQTNKFVESDHRLSRLAFLFFLAGTLVMLFILVWLYNSFLSFIYERDRAHAQLAAVNAELEERIDQRTQELQNFNEELQQFAYVASHDLQEPLRTITSFTQLLASRYQGQLDEDANEFIGYIVNSSRRMTDLINGLLALVRLRKAGQAPVAVPFATLVEEAQVSLQAAIRESGATVAVGTLPSLVIDRLQFSQVFQNLIANAIKYRREDPPVVRIEAHRDSSNWVFSVADNGRGFDQKFAERIFGLFQRLHAREVEGTGMGLAIARRIVERHGGRMWADSKEGVGATFFFSLPVSLEAVAKGRSQTPELTAQKP
jgi:signal transduction histidine kinase